MLPLPVFIAHSMALYASTLANALMELRPGFDVRHVAVDELDAVVGSAPGALVICDRLTADIETRAGAYILYYPEQQNLATIAAAGAMRTILDPEWSDLLDAIDGVAAGIGSGATGYGQDVLNLDQLC